MNVRIISLLCIACFFSGIISAQQSSYQRINNVPVFQNGYWLENPWAGGLNHPLFSAIDLNGDGIKDIFSFEISGGSNGSNGRIECFINQGIADSVNYKYSSAYVSSFPYLHDWVLLRDFNCDGKADIFAFSDDFTGIKVYENTSSGGNLQFQLFTPLITAIRNGQSITLSGNSVIYPAILDVDNDGDLDILRLTGSTGNPPRTVEYYKNLSEENGWNCDSLAFQFETACWGNFAFCSTNAVCTWNSPCREIEYSDNNKVVYDPTSAAPRDDSLTSIFAFPDSGNVPKNLLIGDLAAANTLLVTNGGTAAAANMVSQDTNFPSYDTPINLESLTNHAYIDVNNDGKKDLLVSGTDDSNINCIEWYENNNTDTAPTFSYQSTSFLQDQMIDVGEGCYPVFFDYNGDGLMDIVIGNNSYNYNDNGLNGIVTSLTLYKNIGTATSPAFELVTTDYGNISSLNGLTGPIYPAFGDLNGDGKPDLILGTGDGSLIYFTNIGSSDSAIFQYDTATYMGIGGGGNATPQLIDLNRDGKLDLVIGNRDGYLRYYENMGTKNNAYFNSIPKIDSLGQANTYTTVFYSGNSVPFIYNDSINKYEMYLAGELGYVCHYNNIDNNLNGTFTLTDTLISLTEGQNLSVSGADINSDGKLDLIIGNDAGGAGIFSQYMPVSVPALPEVQPSFKLLPNPAANTLTIQISNLKETDCLLSIVDMLGRNVKSIPVNSTTIMLDISYLSDGIYIVELQSTKFYDTRKLVIRH